MKPMVARLLFVAALAGLPVLAPASVSARPPAQFSESKFAALAIDAVSGEVLYEHGADAVRHPASLTKMMTLYLVFDEISAGRMRPSDEVPVSAHAASRPPTKLGLRAGDTVRLDDAVQAVAIRSANDVAVALAERLAGTEEAFAARMTQKAITLGMRDTVFRNASGLPHSGQITTARDMAVLARALLRDHPQHYRVFSQQSFAYGGRDIYGHNRVTQRYQGADGLKTGFINASGFNLVSSAVRDDRRLVAVVLGGPTAGARDAYMEDLLTSGFAVLRQRRIGKSMTVAELLPLPNLSPVSPSLAREGAQGDR